MKKILIMFVVTLMASAGFSNDEAAIDELFAGRAPTEEGVQIAMEAATQYGVLADVTEDTETKARLEVKESDALYYVGDLGDKEAKIKYHGLGDMNLVDAVTSLEELAAGTPEGEDLERVKMLLARAIYVKAANMGQWAVATGIKTDAVQNRLGEMTTALARIKELGRGYPRGTGPLSTNDYGILRIEGQLALKLYDNVEAALSAFKTAFKLTGGSVKNATPSRHSTNNLYYAKVSIAVNDLDTARTVLKALVAADAQTLHPNRIPETLKDQKEAQAILSSIGG